MTILCTTDAEHYIQDWALELKTVWSQVFVLKGNNVHCPQVNIYFTTKYPLCGYILGVLTHSTAWDRLWRGDETLNNVAYT